MGDLASKDSYSQLSIGYDLLRQKLGKFVKVRLPALDCPYVPLPRDTCGCAGAGLQRGDGRGGVPVSAAPAAALAPH